MGRRRVPLPPERISPFSGSMARKSLSSGGLRASSAWRRASVDAAELAVIPGCAAALDELERDALFGLRVDERAPLGRQLGERAGVARSGVAQHDLGAEPGDSVEVAMHDDVALEHDAAQLGILR